MANKFKKGDSVIIVRDYANNLKSSEDGREAIFKAYLPTDDSAYKNGYRYIVDSSSGTNHLVVAEIKLLNSKTNNMATKATKKSGLIPKEGMYFTANMGKKKIRGYISSVYSSSYNNLMGVMLDGKDFSRNDEDGDFPTYEEINYYKTEETFEEALKRNKITNFVVCTDKRQKAVIDGDKSPMFGDWKVVNDGGILTFGCGKVKLSIKDAKLFAEIFCDYGCANEIACYQDTISGNDTCVEEYYQVRKYLEDNYTAAQKAIFDDVLETIDSSGEQDISGLECSEMKELLAKF